jgi:opacity protein-like surface antigen
MNNRTSALLSASLVLAAAAAAAADYAPAAHEVWSGVYRCGPMQTDSGRSPGYTSSIRMTVEGTSATINKESGDIRETLSGDIKRDGTLRLEGTGTRRDSRSAGWRYRYEGRFEGARFEARGAMLSSNLATRLRDCSMTLARIQRFDKPARTAQASAPEPAQPEAATRRQPEAAAPEASARRPRRAGVPEAVNKELDFSDRNDAATMEGTVERGAPHRYGVIARRGQRLTATLTSDEGARFDVYEPGSTLTMLSGGFVVQGARLAASEEGKHVDAAIPADGKYLLLVRTAKDPAFYTLDLAVEGATPSFFERWKNDRRVWVGGAIAALLLLWVLVRRRKRDRRMFRPD